MHDALAAVTTPNQTIVVSDQQITNAGGVGRAVVGPGRGGDRGHRVDRDVFGPGGGGRETVADFAATIVWGDGTTDVGTVVSDGGGAYRVDAPDHTYVEEGTYTVTVTVKHDALATLTSNGHDRGGRSADYDAGGVEPAGSGSGRHRRWAPSLRLRRFRTRRVWGPRRRRTSRRRLCGATVPPPWARWSVTAAALYTWTRRVGTVCGGRHVRGDGDGEARRVGGVDEQRADRSWWPISRLRR